MYIKNEAYGIHIPDIHYPKRHPFYGQIENDKDLGWQWENGKIHKLTGIHAWPCDDEIAKDMICILFCYPSTTTRFMAKLKLEDVLVLRDLLNNAIKYYNEEKVSKTKRQSTDTV